MDAVSNNPGISQHEALNLITNSIQDLNFNTGNWNQYYQNPPGQDQGIVNLKAGLNEYAATVAKGSQTSDDGKVFLDATGCTLTPFEDNENFVLLGPFLERKCPEDPSKDTAGVIKLKALNADGSEKASEDVLQQYIQIRDGNKAEKELGQIGAKESFYVLFDKNRAIQERYNSTVMKN